MALLQYQMRMMYQLLFWAGLCLGVGLSMMLSTREWVRSFGGMTAAWAAVNLLIALFALRGVRRKAKQSADVATVQQWARQLVRLLWINVGLDCIYILAGAGLIVWEPTNRMLNGFGWAVVIQGAFLLVFDAWHGVKVGKMQVAG